ncbi:type II toxin-antitoxin system YafQ family toxin [Candidatus Protochlamydia sp. R18]|uniref:type II toxin-antitoxin system YafQ family toxin n=1 Tax=Candidatus Protochlamydia sp. R18 TaxID=1353977 RepID=UPI0005AB1927|nr:type II toxin-antitoxin system mRNA interferase toxin, RelE/StbE family [Candidatus Protochlamydia sp. R18]
MLHLKNSTKFKKDLKKFQHQQHIIDELNTVVTALLKKQTLDPKYSDHSLSGDWVGNRECHIKPDVLLIYWIDEEKGILFLERIGSHSNLFK